MSELRLHVLEEVLGEIGWLWEFQGFACRVIFEKCQTEEQT